MINEKEIHFQYIGALQDQLADMKKAHRSVLKSLKKVLNINVPLLVCILTVHTDTHRHTDTNTHTHTHKENPPPLPHMHVVYKCHMSCIEPTKIFMFLLLIRSYTFWSDCIIILFIVCSFCLYNFLCSALIYSLMVDWAQNTSQLSKSSSASVL